MHSTNVHGRLSSLHAAVGKVFPQRLLGFSSSFFPLVFLPYLYACGQALERQKEYFDCIRNERDELREELADIKGKSKMGEVGRHGCCAVAPLQESRVMQC